VSRFLAATIPETGVRCVRLETRPALLRHRLQPARLHRSHARLFKMMTGLNLVHIPYRGGYLPDLLSGQVQVVFGTIDVHPVHQGRHAARTGGDNGANSQYR
jgi:hypothetical protein